LPFVAEDRFRRGLERAWIYYGAIPRNATDR